MSVSCPRCLTLSYLDFPVTLLYQPLLVCAVEPFEVEQRRSRFFAPVAFLHSIECDRGGGAQVDDEIEVECHVALEELVPLAEHHVLGFSHRAIFASEFEEAKAVVLDRPLDNLHFERCRGLE